MRAVFSHLSGPRRGEVDTVEVDTVEARILIGSDAACDVRLEGHDAVAGRHAEVVLDDCDYFARDLASPTGTFVNGRRIAELILKDGDMLEIGAGGPKLRFRVQVADGEVCRPLRLASDDPLERSPRPGTGAPPSTPDILTRLGLGLQRETSPWTRRLLAAALVLIASSFLLSVAVFIRGTRAGREVRRDIVKLERQAATERRSREQLEKSIVEERNRAAEAQARQDREMNAQLALLREEERGVREQLREARERSSSRGIEIRTLEAKAVDASRRLQAFEEERTLGERTIARFQGGVAFLEGAYGFEDASGRPVRHPGKGQEALGKTGPTTGGTGEILVAPYSGTGFLVRRDGLILTNRHVAEPWWTEKETAQLAQKGFRPRLIALRAYFPAVDVPFDLRVVNVSEKADVALVKASLGDQVLPVLELEKRRSTAASGQPIVLLGYPTGLDALLARLHEPIADAVEAAAGDDLEKTSRELARRGMIRPLATQGHLSDVLPHRLVYDAQTTVGGSGGPIFNAAGKVIGVNFAVLTEFSGASFGVPISFGVELLQAAGPAPRERRVTAPRGLSP